jgi:hypothetical protein
MVELAEQRLREAGEGSGLSAMLAGAGRGPWRAARRGRRVPYVAFGALLVLACVVSFVLLAARLGDRVLVLAVARPVAAGQTITPADLTRVSAVDDPALALVPAEQAGQVLGRSAVVPLLPGTLLTTRLVGDAAFPPAGQVVSSLALKPGQYPQGLPVGSHVEAFVNAASGTGGQASAALGGRQAQLSAVVLGVDPAGDGQGGTLVTLLLDASDAAFLAGAPTGGVVLMQTSPGGG